MGTLHVWVDTAWMTTRAIDDHECVADGERLWVWTDGEVVRVNFEEWDGQADVALPALFAEFPEVRALPIAGDGPWDPDVGTLGEVCRQPHADGQGRIPGTVPAAALTAVIDRDGRRELDRVDAPAPGC